MVGIDRADRNADLWTAITGFVLLLCALPFFLAPLNGLWQAGFCLLVGVIASCPASGSLCWPTAPPGPPMLAPLSYAQLHLVVRLRLRRLRHSTPDRWTLVGAVIIALSGTYVVHLERVRVAALRTGALPRPVVKTEHRDRQEQPPARKGLQS